MGRYVLAWVPMVFVAIANGTLREVFIRRFLPEVAARQLSTVTAIILLGAYMFAVVHHWTPHSGGQAFRVGVVWLLLTLAFEFLFGHFVAGQPWPDLLADYNVLAGRLWVLIPAWVALAPYLFFRLEAAP